MHAQPIEFAVEADERAPAISPRRVPLALLRSFARDVDEFVRGGDEAPLDTQALSVEVRDGSLALRTEPVADTRLLHDIQLLARLELLDGLAPRRQVVVQRWQAVARSARALHFRISAPMLELPVRIDASSDYRADDADQWVKVERYVRGEIEDLGGHTNPNAHVRLPDGTRLLVQAGREQLRDDKANRLYKQAMLRMTAEFNVMTRAYRNARLLEFVEHEHRLDAQAMKRLTERGAKAWADVPDAARWVDELRGGSDL